MSNDINSSTKILKILEDHRFAEWVLSDHKLHHEYWASFIANQNNAASQLAEAEALLLHFRVSETDSIQKIEDTLSPAPTKSPVKLLNSRIFRIASIAAACLITFFFALKIFQLEENITASGKMVNHSLPDGSRVIINKKSSIAYSKNNFSKERTLTLHGEAFFEVKKGSTFSIVTPHGKIEVLGTSFNVYSRDERLEVTCKTGSVAVTYNTDKSKEILTAGQKIIVSTDKSRLLNNKFAPDLWTTGIFEFDSVDIQIVLEELSRQFDLNLEVKADLNAKKYSGKFDNKNIHSAIKSVCWPMRYNCTVEGKILIVSNQNIARVSD
jgi:transmembrane sensor